MEVNFPLVGLSLLISTGVLLFIGEYAMAMFSIAMLAVFIKMTEKLL